MSSIRPAIRLDATTKKLEGVLDGAGTDVIFHVFYYDLLSNAETQPTIGSSGSTASNGATDVTICAAPNANSTRNIDCIIVYNGNAATKIATVQIDISGTNYILFYETLLTKQTFMWTPNKMAIM